MKKAYLFIYDDSVGSRDELKNVFNGMPSVTHWRYDVPHCFYLVSEDSAQDLYEAFIALNGKKGRFMFIEASSNSQGQMLPDTWYFLKNKAYKPKPPSAT